MNRSLFHDAPFYALALLAGTATGFTDVMIDDLLLTALLVLASCMLLGLLRPRRPWRWVIAVVIFVPLTEWMANRLMAIQLTRAQIYGTFLAALPGIAGAYGGSQVRIVIDNLREGK